MNTVGALEQRNTTFFKQLDNFKQLALELLKFLKISAFEVGWKFPKFFLFYVSVCCFFLFFFHVKKRSHLIESQTFLVLYRRSVVYSVTN